VAAIVFHRVKHQTDLVGPMLHGDKALPAGTPPAADGTGPRLLALVLAAACAGLVAWVLRLGG
jgi:hypothetical protein